MDDLEKKMAEYRKVVHTLIESGWLSPQEAERLQIENIQLKFACGYAMPAELERHIVGGNPFKCGICDANGTR